MNNTLIEVESVSKKFCRSLRRSLWYGLQDLGNELLCRRQGGHDELRKDEFWAAKDISFKVERGECLGLIGHNGAGKTTLLRMLNGLVKPDQGRITMRGRVGALIALGAGFNPILTGRENIQVNGSVLGLSKRQLANKIDEIIDFAEVEDFIDAPVRSYSSGMVVRLGFAIAATIEPEILLLDEVLAVGDAGFREKCYSKIGEIKRYAATIIVSHHMPHINQICDKVVLLDHGAVQHSGTVDKGVALYQELCEGNKNQQRSGFMSLSKSIETLEMEFSKKELPHNESLTISFEIDSTDEMSDVLLRVVFVSIDNELIAEWNSGALGRKIDIKKGKNSLDIFIEKMQMKSGKYYVDVIIYDDTRLVYLAHVHRKFSISITGTMSIPSRFLVGG